MALSLLSVMWVWIRAPTWTRGGSDVTSYVHSSNVTSEFLSLYLSFRKAQGEILPQNKNSSRKSTATWKLPWEGFVGRSDELTGYMQLETWLLANIQTFAFLCLVEAAAFELDSGWREKSYVRISKPFFVHWGGGTKGFGACRVAVCSVWKLHPHLQSSVCHWTRFLSARFLQSLARKVTRQNVGFHFSHIQSKRIPLACHSMWFN